jgi:hypothetical protein
MRCLFIYTFRQQQQQQQINRIIASNRLRRQLGRVRLQIARLRRKQMAVHVGSLHYGKSALQRH